MAKRKRNKNTPPAPPLTDETSPGPGSGTAQTDERREPDGESAPEQPGAPVPEPPDEAPPAQPETETEETAPEPEPLTPEQENERLEARIEELTNLHLRAVADLDNYRKRARRELAEALRYACGDLMTDLLPVLDNFARALETEPENTDSAGFRQGVELILKQLTDTLAKHGLSPVPALHEPFDPARHEALGQVETEEVEPGLVAQEVRRGYQLYDRVLRASQVFVAAAPPPCREEQEAREGGESVAEAESAAEVETPAASWPAEPQEPQPNESREAVAPTSESTEGPDPAPPEEATTARE